MKLSDRTVADNITEILSGIIEFTRQRQEVLSRNIFDYRKAGFHPIDLAVGEFADRLTRGLAEHLRCQKLLLRDSEHIFFESEGRFSAVPMVDCEAEALMRSDPKAYIREQVKKLNENYIYNRVAVEVLSKKRKHDDLLP